MINFYVTINLFHLRSIEPREEQELKAITLQFVSSNNKSRYHCQVFPFSSYRHKQDECPLVIQQQQQRCVEVAFSSPPTRVAITYGTEGGKNDVVPSNRKQKTYFIFRHTAFLLRSSSSDKNS